LPVPSCGVSSHAPECLCDVVITSPVVIRPDLTLADFEGGPELAERLGFPSVTATDEALLDVLDHLARRRDALVALDDLCGDRLREGFQHEQPAERLRFGGAHGAANLTKLTHGAALFIRERANSSMSNAELRAETNRIFGTKMSPSHMSHARKRYSGVAL
jgi:hypothetical protein